MCDKIYTILARKKASNKINFIFVVLNYFCIRAHALIIGAKKILYLFGLLTKLCIFVSLTN